MCRWRTRVLEATPTALVVFLATSAAPHAGLFFHVHADGEHFHVHAEDVDAGLEPHHHGQHHHVRHLHVAGAHAQDVGIEATDTPTLGHWHAQSPFHRVVVPAPTTLQWAQIAACQPSRIDLGVGVTPRCRRQARAPPALA
jgi:hypothetical protein